MSINTVKKRPKYLRKAIAPIHLKPIHEEILKLLYQYRFLNTNQLIAMTGKTYKAVKKAMNDLYNDFYVDRPEAQKKELGYNAPMVSAISDKGAKVVARLYDDRTITKLNWTLKNKNLQGDFLEHDLMISQFYAGLKLLERKFKEIKFISPQTIINNRFSSPSLKSNPLKKKEKIKREFNVLPDGAFGIDYIDPEIQKRTIKYFFLEADQATEPIARKDFFQSSINKKLTLYISSRNQKLFSANFGFKNVRVLFITKTERRLKNMIKLNQEINKEAPRLFKFALAEKVLNLDIPENIIARAWINGKGETCDLLN